MCVGQLEIVNTQCGGIDDEQFRVALRFPSRLACRVLYASRFVCICSRAVRRVVDNLEGYRTRGVNAPAARAHMDWLGMGGAWGTNWEGVQWGSICPPSPPCPANPCVHALGLQLVLRRGVWPLRVL